MEHNAFIQEKDNEKAGDGGGGNRIERPKSKSLTTKCRLTIINGDLTVSPAYPLNNVQFALCEINFRTKTVGSGSPESHTG